MADSMDILIQQLKKQQGIEDDVVNEQQNTQQQSTQQQGEQKQEVTLQKELEQQQNVEQKSDKKREGLKEEDIEKEIDELLKIVNEQQKIENVNNKSEVKEKTVPDFIKKHLDDQLSIEDLEEISKYINDLEEERENILFELRKLKIERDQYEQMLQKEQQRNIEVADRLRSLEWELKQLQANKFPEELKNLGDYFRLNKERPNNYVKMQLIGEAINLLEQLTNIPGDKLIEYWLSSQGNSLPESYGSSLDFATQQKPSKEDEKESYLQKLAF